MLNHIQCNLYEIFYAYNICLIESNFSALFKGFVFNCDLDRIKDKTLWPRGAVVCRYRKPYAERNQNTQSSSEAKTSNTPKQSNTN
ncbi:hypothetical protein BpHYR1_035866 [Brachionus plicatilis]|uniref:Uncharacterized protein n=1 Tax=Brachionus plicatilis TaxID=10195 RepID=A0A3M7PVA0_BRAPC|nr:hypothetical protein BpHYR1_035866 [Brachionus plicatilis]